MEGAKSSFNILDFRTWSQFDLQLPIQKELMRANGSCWMRGSSRPLLFLWNWEFLFLSRNGWDEELLGHLAVR